ncbi:MAG: hypothetical protein U0164_10745 [Gemmatimonadaceae bacterium]
MCVIACALLLALAAPRARAQANPDRLERGRFTILAYPQDASLARSLLHEAIRFDTFPGLPRPRSRLLIQVAPDRPTFRSWIGPGAPEWGAAFAVPRERRIILQGSSAPSEAGDPLRALRHELAHLALHEYLGDLAPRWFDEGYASFAAGEWDREQVIATNVALAWRGVPSLEALDSGFFAGPSRADAAYALAHRAVAELAALDQRRGLALLLEYWKEEGAFEPALRRAYGMTQGQFEQRFRAQTRRRYGALALAADVMIASTLMAFFVGPFYVIRRRRDKARLAAMRIADLEAERRERESALEQLLRDVTPTSSEGPTLKDD